MEEGFLGILFVRQTVGGGSIFQAMKNFAILFPFVKKILVFPSKIGEKQ